MELTQNVKNTERVGRAIFSLLLVGAALKKGGKAGVIMSFIAGDIMSSAISGYCPLCAILGLHGGSCCECGDSCCG